MTYEFRGESYATLSKLYSVHKDLSEVTLGSVKKRFEGGWDIEKCLTEPKGFMPGKPLYEFLGSKYPSLRALYIDNKKYCIVSYSLFLKRVEEGMSIEEAMSAPKKKTGGTRVEPQVIEGVTFTLLADIAEKYGVNSNTIFKRYSRGRRNDDLVMPKEIKNPPAVAKQKTVDEPEVNADAIEFRGKTYKNINQLVIAFAVNRRTYFIRRERGLNIAQALGLELFEDGRSKSRITHMFRDEELTIPEISAKTGVSASTITDRLLRDADIELAVSKGRLQNGTLGKRRGTSRKIEIPELIVDGVKYSTFKSLADAYGLKTYVVNQRIVIHGYTAEEAVKGEGKFKTFEVDGRKFPSMKEAAKEFRITADLIKKRLDIGWTDRQAVGLDARPSTTQLTFRGKFYSKLADIEQEHGLRNGALSRRMGSGMSMEEAVSAGHVIKNPGRYNQTILERNPDLANKSAIVYFVSMLIEDKLRYKIGITTSTVNDRLRGEGYLYNELATYPGTLLKCFSLEKQLHELLELENDRSFESHVMDGYTELFDLSDDDVEAVLGLLSD
jgi:hypothetical protein|tara:strand:- start:199 stop:1863 length:1665 start_codon:yes stop_codon:yes gene_type:complete